MSATIDVYLRNPLVWGELTVLTKRFQYTEIDMVGKSHIVHYIKMQGKKQFVCSIDGPFAIDRSDIPESINEFIPEPKWLVSISLHPCESPYPDFAFELAKFMAVTFNGIAYDCQNEKIFPSEIFPRKRARRNKHKRADIVEIMWLFPVKTKVTDIGNALISIICQLCPDATPTRYGDFEPFQSQFSIQKVDEFLTALRMACDGPTGIGHIFWESKRPFWGGSLGCSPSGARASIGVRYRYLKLLCDRNWITTNQGVSEIIQNMFVEISKKIGSFYATGYVVRNVIIGRKVWFDSQTEQSPFPKGGVWLGLPMTPTWLTWYGIAYVPYVKKTLDGFNTSSYDNGIFISHGITPMTADDVRHTAPNIPETLLVKMVSPPNGISEVSEFMAAGFTDISFEKDRFVVNPIPRRAELIPELG
jgi:hypothetical protein